jgi:hypothetical protein
VSRVVKGEDISGSGQAQASVKDVVEASHEALRDAGYTHVVLYRGVNSPDTDPFARGSSMMQVENGQSSGVTSWTTDADVALGYGPYVAKAVVPVEQIVSFDLVGSRKTAGGGLTPADGKHPLTGQEVLVAADPKIVSGLTASALVAACRSKDCAPPPVGKGGSLPEWKFDPSRLGDWESYVELTRSVIGDALDVQADRLVGMRDYAADHLAVRVPIEALSMIVSDGRLRSQHETGSSMGFYDPGLRTQAEQRLFGTDPATTPLDMRPIYGYVEGGAQKMRPDAIAPDYVQGYGEVVIRLKPSVAERTTITVGDSLNGDDENRGPIGLPVRGAVGRDLAAAAVSSDGVVPYVETQVHGGLTTQDIREVYIPDVAGSNFSSQMSAHVAVLQYAQQPIKGVPLVLGTALFGRLSASDKQVLADAGVEVRTEEGDWSA